jgi:hypothetical protein
LPIWPAQQREWLNRQRRQRFDKTEELHGAGFIVASKEPPMAFGDSQGGGGLIWCGSLQTVSAP